MINLALANINSFDFNIFELDQIAEKQTIQFMSNEIFSKLGFFDKKLINEDKFLNFMYILAEGYSRNVPYHNDLHAGDVFQTTYKMISSGKIIKVLNYNDIDIFSILLASLAHDFKHPGGNNLYQINAKTQLALTYNDASVLENFHVFLKK